MVIASVQAQQNATPTQAEFDGAYLRLMERYGALDWDNLTEYQLEHLSLLANGQSELERWDRDVLRDWAAAKGIDMSTDAYLPNAPILYMMKLLCKYGVSLEEALEVIGRE